MAAEVERKPATLAFDIEGTGAQRRDNQMISWGWCLKCEETGEQEEGQVALYLGKRSDEDWEGLWERYGFDMKCFEFWKKNMDKLEPLQISPDTGECTAVVHDEKGNIVGKEKYERYPSLESFLTDNGPVPIANNVNAVIEHESYEEFLKEQQMWRSEHCDQLRKLAPLIFYIRAYTERDMMSTIHEILKRFQESYELTYLSDTLHYDASWTDMLLEKYGYPPLLHDQEGRPQYKYMSWGRELGSMQMGLAAGDNTPATKEQYSKMKRWVEGRIENGWDAKNSHFAVDDALKISGSWDECMRENRRRFKLHQRVANALSDDSAPNSVLFYDFIEEHVEELCERAAKRQK